MSFMRRSKWVKGRNGRRSTSPTQHIVCHILKQLQNVLDDPHINYENPCIMQKVHNSFYTFKFSNISIFQKKIYFLPNGMAQDFYKG